MQSSTDQKHMVLCPIPLSIVCAACIPAQHLTSFQSSIDDNCRQFANICLRLARNPKKTKKLAGQQHTYVWFWAWAWVWVCGFVFGDLHKFPLSAVQVIRNAGWLAVLEKRGNWVNC